MIILRDVRDGSTVYSSNATTTADALAEAVLKGVSVQWLDLAGQDLRGAVVRRAVLNNSDLSGCNLEGAELRYCSLEKCNLEETNLRRALLVFCSLDRSRMRRVRLEETAICYCSLDGCDMTDCNMVEVVLQFSSLFRTRLSGSSVHRGQLVGSRPFLQIYPMGSRDDCLTLFNTDSGVMVRTGCFFGSSEDFRTVVKLHHGDNIFAKEYARALEMALDVFNLWDREDKGDDNG